MSRLLDIVHVLTIPSGQTASNAVVIGGWLRACSIFAPGTLPETVTVQIEPTATGTDFKTLRSGAADVEVPAGKAVIIMEGVYKQIRLLAGGAVAADRVFSVNSVIER